MGWLDGKTQYEYFFLTSANLPLPILWKERTRKSGQIAAYFRLFIWKRSQPRRPRLFQKEICPLSKIRYLPGPRMAAS